MRVVGNGEVICAVVDYVRARAVIIIFVVTFELFAADVYRHRFAALAVRGKLLRFGVAYELHGRLFNAAFLVRLLQVDLHRLFAGYTARVGDSCGNRKGFAVVRLGY